MVNRIWLTGLGVLVWQLCSMSFGFNEFMFGHPAPVAAVLASLATALAWMALSGWAGYRQRTGFGVSVAILWLVIIAVLLLAMWTKELEGDYSVAPWHGGLLLLLILAGGPLYSLGSLLPIQDALLATTTVAGLILTLIVTAFLTGRLFGWRGKAAISHDDASSADAR